MIRQGMPTIGAAIFSLILLMGLPYKTAHAEDPIVLKGVTPWMADYDLSKAFFIFQDLVKEKFGDRVKIEYLGGPEVVESSDQFSALKNGVVDVILGAAAYYRSEVPLAAAIQLTTRLPSELRKSGYYDLMRNIHAEAGVVYLANTAGGNKFRIYLREPISKPDFSGLRLRGSPVYLPMIKALGGAPVSIAPGDVYTALERNLIDGYGWTYTGIDVFGWNEVSEYVIDHPFYSLDGAILINEEVWDKLPKDVQEGLNALGPELELRVEAAMKETLRKEDARLKNLGMKFIEFSPEDAKYYIETTQRAGWEDFKKLNAAAFKQNPGLAQKLQETGS